MNNSNTDYVEAIKNKWMTGRGTKFLYAAIAVLLWCALGSAFSTAAAVSKADTASKNAIQIAQNYSAVCTNLEFYRANEDNCMMARRVIANPTEPVSPLVEHIAPGTAEQLSSYPQDKKE